MKLPNKLLPWADARRRHRLSDAHVAMARELGLNPAKLGKIDNHRQEPWKAPLPEYIEYLYRKQFGRPRPELVRSLEQIAQHEAARKAARRERKLATPTAALPPGAASHEPTPLLPGEMPF